MDYAQELISQKANRLNEYLEQTRELSRLLDTFDTDEMNNLDDLAACMQKRAALVAKIDEIDGLLARKSIAGDQESSGFKNYKRLCRHLLEEIAGVEEQNKDVLTEAMEKLQARMKNNSEIMKGVAAYNPADPTFYYSFDWKK